MTFGGWVSLLAVQPELPFQNYTEPLILLSGDGGKFGLALVDSGWSVMGWVTIGVETVACMNVSLKLTEQSRFHQWFHVALSWAPSESSGDLFIYLNGKLIATCEKGSTSMQPTASVAVKAAKDTYLASSTDPAFLISKVTTGTSFSTILSLTIVNIATRAYSTGEALAPFMGLSSERTVYFSVSDFYWPMSGFLTDIAPYRIIKSKVYSAKDRYNNDMSALCTSGDVQSLVVLTGDDTPSVPISNLGYSCIFETSGCNEFKIVLDFKLMDDLDETDEVDKFLFSTHPANGNSNVIGFGLIVNSAKQTLTAVLRTPFFTCSSAGNLSAFTSTVNWNLLEVTASAKSPPIMALNGDIITLVDSGNCKVESNDASVPEEGTAHPKITIGRSLPICVSDVLLVDIDANQLPVNMRPKDVCYQSATGVDPLAGKEINHLGIPNAASRLPVLITSMATNKVKRCFGASNATLCPVYSLSFWLKVDDSVATEASTLVNFAHWLPYLIAFYRQQQISPSMVVSGSKVR